MSSTPPFASQSQPFLSEHAQPDWNHFSSSQTHAAMGHVALVAPPLIRCQCGAVTPSWMSHAAHCSSTTLPPHCIAMAASILAGSDIREGAVSSTEQSNPQPDFCRDFAAQHPHMTAADGSPLLTEHTPLVDVLRIACCSPCKFFGQHKTAPVGSRGRLRKRAGKIKCYLRAADGNKHSHAMRDAFALIAQWAKDQPGIKAMTDLFNLPAAAGESALGGLRVLCAAGFPSTLLQHVVRFTLQRLRSFTVEWCGGLVKQGRLEAIEEPTLCSYLADLINADTHTPELQPGELELLAQALLRDGIFVQPHDNSRNNDLRRFLIDTLNLNRTMDFQRNFIDFPQLFPSAPSTPTSPSVAPMEEHWSAPPSPSNSSDSSGESRATAPSLELASHLNKLDQWIAQPDSDGQPASKRPCIRDPSELFPGWDEHAQRAAANCRDLSDEDGAAPLPPSTPSPLPTADPAKFGPQCPSPLPTADPAKFGPQSLPAEPLSFPEISPSTP